MALSSEMIAYFHNSIVRQEHSNRGLTYNFSPQITRKVRDFHKTMPGYRQTPLTPLKNLASHLGVARIWIKDESHRFGLNAFKVLGASYALTSALTEKLDLKHREMSFPEFQLPDIQAQLRNITCITATDGNHGRAVAWTAQELGCRSVVYMPKGASIVRLKNIRKHGADASIIDGNFDDAVKLAADQAKAKGWLLIQDTAWPGYEDIPTRIMQGYLTMFDEAFEQLGMDFPTHVFLQCGVGSFAASFQAYLVQRFDGQRPIFVVTEPTKAACFYESITRQDGNPHRVLGEMDTIMVGLACGEPSTLAWEILRDFSDMFVACVDEVARRGMRVLGNPLAGDERIISGESGAVTLGLLYYLMRSPRYTQIREKLSIDNTSKILLFSTEGDTDPDMYRKIVWDE